jgi:hypothetical protein
MYGFSFGVMRKQFTMTLLGSDAEIAVLRCEYFSSNKTTNQVLFRVFYPIHHWILGGETDKNLKTDDDGIAISRAGKTVFFEDTIEFN